MSWSLSSDFHPRQPLIMEADGRTLRFRSNRLIKELFDQHPDRAKLLQDATSSWDDRCQLGQLAGLEWQVLASFQLDPFHGQRLQFINLSPDRRFYRSPTPPIDPFELPHPLQPVLFDRYEQEHFLENALVCQLIQDQAIDFTAPREEPLSQHDMDQLFQLLGTHLYPRPAGLSKRCLERAENWLSAKQQRISLGPDVYHAKQRERSLNRALPAAVTGPAKPRF